MRQLVGITLGLMIGVAATGATPTTGNQQAPRLTCSPTSVPSWGAGVWVSCTIENFSPNTAITVTAPFGGSGQLTTDAGGRAGSRFVIPEFGVCTERSGLTVAASGGGVAASMTIAVTPVPQPPYCGPTGAVPAQPRLTG